MSTKIYNGYFLPNDFDLRTLKKFLLETVRPSFEVHRHSEFLKLFPTPDKYKFTEVWDSIQENDRKGYRDLLDFSASITFIPGRSMLLAMTFWENRGYTKIWEALNPVTPYPYWDNSDHPDDMDYDEWKARGKDWDEALGPAGVPGEAGFSFDLIPIRPPFTHELFPEDQPFG